jgi:hypothetical protein
VARADESESLPIADFQLPIDKVKGQASSSSDERPNEKRNGNWQSTIGNQLR